MIHIPVAVNNSYGDPGLQWDNTLCKLENLAVCGHEGIVGLITKSKMMKDMARHIRSLPLDICMLQSLSGLPYDIEHVKYENSLESVTNCVDSGLNCVVYLRPIIKGINDDQEKIKGLIHDIRMTGCQTMAYSGLATSPEIIRQLEQRSGYQFKDDEKMSLLDKTVEPGLRDMIENAANDEGLDVFRHTSCAVSSATKKDHDYNHHFGFCQGSSGCSGCPMSRKCSRFKPDIEKGAKILNRMRLDTVIADDKLVVLGNFTIGERGVMKWMTDNLVYPQKVVESNRIRKDMFEVMK
jgi:hypothetical protein